MKPKIIAWSKGFQVIPFEHVISVDEHFSITGALLVMVDIKTSNPTGYVIHPQDAQSFIDKYNLYLELVEGLTTTARWVPDNGDEDAKKD